MDLKCLTCDTPDFSSENYLNRPLPECKSFILSKIIKDCLDVEVTSNNVICDGCKVQLILFYQFKLKVAALQLRRLQAKDRLERDFCNKEDTFSDRDVRSPDEPSPILAATNECPASFINLSEFETHTRDSHSTSQVAKEQKTDVSKAFICHFCGIQYTKAAQLKLHIKSIHNSPSKSSLPKSQIITCDICNKVLSNRSALLRHKNLIHNIVAGKSISYPCQICGSNWRTKTTLEYHYLSKHSNERKFKCAMCEKTFFTKHTLVSHLNHVHCSTNNFICHTCGKSFKSQTYLQTHYLVHSQQKPFECDDCGASFKQKASLYFHRKMHREKQKGVVYDCQLCQKIFMNVRSMEKHQKTHTGPELKCDKCEKTYKQKDSLTKHVLAVHNRMKMRVTCRVCSKTLWNRNKMRSHVLEDHSNVLKKDASKTVDDLLERIHVFEETKVKMKEKNMEDKNLKIISVQILNQV